MLIRVSFNRSPNSQAEVDRPIEIDGLVEGRLVRLNKAQARALCSAVALVADGYRDFAQVEVAK